MQGFNRYYRPDYDPKDAHKGNLNRIAGKAAQKPVVRFEMPFNIWCLSCDKHIAQGVRFNAEKKKTGNYFSSPIYSFTMTCHLCQGTIVIATNPKETSYDVISGARRKVEEWNAEATGTFEFKIQPAAGQGEGGDEEVDPLARLEKDVTQRRTVQQSATHITQLLDANRRQWSDPYAQSQKLRREFRTEKARLGAAQEKRERVEERHALGITLLDRHATDEAKAREIEFDGRVMRNLSSRRLAAASGPLFAKGTRPGARDAMSLKAGLQAQTRAKLDPFYAPPPSKALKNMSPQSIDRAPESDGCQTRAQTLVTYESDEA